MTTRPADRIADDLALIRDAPIEQRVAVLLAAERAVE